MITRDADEIERTRRLTPAVTAALIENGLYRALLPKSLGGTEAPLEAFMQMQEEIAKADASTAWCLGQCSVCAMTAAYLDPDAANEIFNVAPGILAWGAIAHEVQAVPGGYMANARWDFASGSRQASWLGAHVRVVEADGTPRRKPDGSPEIRTILFPVTSATMYDVWDVIGLQRHRHQFLFGRQPLHPRKIRSAARRSRGAARAGPALQDVHQHGVQHGLCRDLARRRARNARCRHDLARGKTPQGLKAMRDNNAVQGLIGRTEASLRAARAYLYATAAEVWRDLSRGEPITEQHRVALRIAATWTIHQSASVVDTAYHMAGATAVFAANKFERRFRDMHAIAQQIQARDTHYEDAGKAILSANLDAPPTAR